MTARRPGRFPVRISLNVTDLTADTIDHLEHATGDPRVVITREAVNRGLALMLDEAKQRATERRNRQPAGSIPLDTTPAGPLP